MYSKNAWRECTCKTKKHNEETIFAKEGFTTGKYMENLFKEGKYMKNILKKGEHCIKAWVNGKTYAKDA